VERFDEFDLHPDVLAAIEGMGIVKPTPIQALATEPVLKGRDVIAKAETGTGKTLAFGAPMISKIDPNRASVLALALCPTRELAEQVAKVLEQLGAARGIRVALIVGGEPAGPQVEALHAGAQVVVGTPGRVLDLYQQKFLSFPWTEFVVLDEADEMLEIGFIDDVEKIMTYTPEERQTLLFSATFPDQLLRLARKHTKDPAEVATASGVKTVDNIQQEYITLDDSDRPLALIRLIEQSDEDDVFLVFCERRTEVERLMRRLERLPFSVKALHGGYDQASRFRVMSAFREKQVKVLVATDVASRGLDVKHVTRVVNYSVPRSITDYTHRIGRTGRAGREGHAVTLVDHEHMHRWRQLLREATWEIERVDPPERGRPRRDRGERAPEGRRRERGDGDRPERGDRTRSRRERDDAERPVRRERDEDERPRRARGDAEHSRRERDEDERPRRERDEDDRPRRAGRGARGREERAEEPRARRERPSREERPARDQDRAPVRRRDEGPAPVTLPTDRQVRRRDPGDPPRRARLAPELESRLADAREERAPRSEAPGGSDDGPRRPRRERGPRSERAPRNRREDGHEERSEPRREERPAPEPRRRPTTPPDDAGGFGAGL
jgi:ATP-dependent RNA helicase DeaD